MRLYKFLLLSTICLGIKISGQEEIRKEGRQFWGSLHIHPSHYEEHEVAEVKEPCSLPMLSVDMENKENGSVGVKNSMENGRPPDPADWAVMDVVNYFRTAGFEEQASAFQEQEIDGKSLLLMTRNDVLTGLQLKLGPALKIYEYHVKPLQTKHLKNNSS
ncbi:sterile alpha motif domain-containing protein 13 isoform X1 [Lontra canadensis]|uniref:sterile alpha motif domain-containing protein 13 isoform X1 n=1 Tax=Lontra canadensis TaxID=76717 RepID=UPI0013F2E95E|nr:sterile alpha motif domain-containing protein 13 isoform X1 [Lontra canadensis]XP_032726140.1 sterile alpha motif domain-containing protein 13 isoform X1 [Lontra canadensis]